ncbi:MAG: SMC family ATPase [Lachnospiraceae bacterium]|nr:SMC family ATPase [Lachnospiraceae bacterium]
MKPIELVIQAFGPYKDREVIDFEELNRRGMVLIKGPTGSGKTTIFDAMTVALYGGGSGLNSKNKTGRNDFAQWRCNQASREKATIVSLTFEQSGHVYRFTRTLTPKRVNLDETCSFEVMGPDGVFKSAIENPKGSMLNAKAEELIGLSKDQFRQVIMLPQGQFENFLTAGSSEKEAILSKIFGMEKWKNISDTFFAMASDRKNRLDTAYKAVVNSLDEEEKGFNKLEDLERYISDLKLKIAELERDYREYDSAKKIQDLNSDRALSSQFDEYRRIYDERQLLFGKVDEYKEKRQRLADAQKAESVRTYLVDYERAVTDVKNRKYVYDKCLDNIPQYEQRVYDALKAKDDHEKNSPVAGLQKLQGEYSSKRGIYENIDRLLDNYSVAKANVDRADKQLIAASQTEERSVGAAKRAKQAFDEADKFTRSCRDRYYAGIYGDIADGLVDGEPCPVCGSTAHPKLAVKEPDSVSKQDVDDAQAAQDRARNAWNSAEEARQKAVLDKQTAMSNLADKKSLLTQAQTNLTNAREGMIEGIDSLSALDAKIRAIAKQIIQYEAQGKQLEEAYNRAFKDNNSLKTQRDTAKLELEKATENYTTTREALRQSLHENGYKNSEEAKSFMLDNRSRDELAEDVTQFNTRCGENNKTFAAIKDKLKGKTQPDASQFDARQREISQKDKLYHSETGRLNSEIVRLDKKYAQLSKAMADYNSQINEAEADYTFAKRLRGDSGIGLQRYVLGIMFNQVIGEANEMLKKVHGGRYKLVRSDEKGVGNKRGLELIAHDNRKPDDVGRNVSMLSGGEKFLVSLALSIGMSSVAQKSGLKIDALFIDEGFGTLDENSIDDAMEILKDVQKGHGLIGIISHVDLLQGIIETQIEVVKTKEGSTIKMC